MILPETYRSRRRYRKEKGHQASQAARAMTTTLESSKTSSHDSIPATPPPHPPRRTKFKRIHLKHLNESSLEKLMQSFDHDHQQQQQDPPKDMVLVDLWIGPVLSQLFMGAGRSWRARHLSQPEENILERLLLFPLKNATRTSAVRSLVINVHLSDRLLDALARILSDNNHKDNNNGWCGTFLESLDLSFHTELNDDNIRPLVKALRTNTSLTNLSFLHCPHLTHTTALLVLECLRGNHNMTLQHMDWMGTAFFNQAGNSANHDNNMRLKRELDFYLNLNQTGRQSFLRSSPQIQARGNSRPQQQHLIDLGRIPVASGHVSCSKNDDDLALLPQSVPILEQLFLRILLQHQDTDVTHNLSVVYYYLQETAMLWSARAEMPGGDVVPTIGSAVT